MSIPTYKSNFLVFFCVVPVTRENLRNAILGRLCMVGFFLLMAHWTGRSHLILQGSGHKVSSEVQERLNTGGCYLRRVLWLDSSVPEVDMVGLGDPKPGDL